MGVIGTGVAAGVAQTALQAQQVSRQRNKRVTDNTRAAQRMRELAEVRLRGIEEQDVGDDPNRIFIDSHIPEHEHHELPEVRRRKHHQHRQIVDTSALTGRAPAEHAEPSNFAAAAYQHTGEKTPTHKLDVEG